MVPGRPVEGDAVPVAARNGLRMPSSCARPGSGPLAAGALALLLGAAACVDGSPTAPGGAAARAVLLVAPVFASGAAPPEAPITRASLTARDVLTGEVYGTATVALDPEAEAWTLPLTLEIPADRTVAVVVLVQLIAVVDGIEVVQWSGETAAIPVAGGEQPQEIRRIPLFRGPPGNLDVTALTLSAPPSVIEGDGFLLDVEIEGAGDDAVVYFGSLDPGIATPDGAGAVTTHARGVARLVAVAGRLADTVAVSVEPWPLPAPADLAVIDPGLTDAVERITPRLAGDPAAAGTLADLLARIRHALSGGLGLIAHRAASDARATLAAYAGGGPAAVADGPELDVVGLVLDHVERLLGAAR